MTDRPDDSGLEDLLKNIRPQPTDRFYRAMEHAAWNRHDPTLLYFRSMLATALLMVVLVWTVPLVRLGAEELYNVFFDDSQGQLVETSFVTSGLTHSVPKAQ
jgi:hypothetical protein